MRDNSRNRLCLRHWLLLQLTVLLVTVVTSLPVHNHEVEKRTPILSNVDSRQQCTTKLGTCQFYSHCIESLFLCESTGFSIAYAEKRCEQIRRLQSLGVTEDQVVRWQQDSERCFQERLLDLVNGDFQNITADPPSCLRLERRAIEELNSCYETVNSSICSLLDQTLSIESLQRNLSIVAEAVAVDESYYRSMAEEALSNSIRKCNHTESVPLADSLISVPLPLRLIFCVYGEIYDLLDGEMDPEIEQYSRRLSNHFVRPIEQFVYSGPDTMRICAINTPPDASTTVDYHLVTWLADANDSTALAVERNANFSRPDQDPFIFFEKRTERRPTLCGNGRREAGELCDYSGGDGNCNVTTCMPISDFECHTHLGPSSCWRTECGDGVRTSNEECDDGNNLTGDGCSSTCKIETQYGCLRLYNRTSVCSQQQQTLPTAGPTSLRTSHTHITTPTLKSVLSGTDRTLQSTSLLVFVALSAILTIHALTNR